MVAGIAGIKKLYREQRYDEALAEVLVQLEANCESPTLWVLRGNLIQLADNNPFPLEDAERSYLKALEIDPGHLEAMEDLAHFYQAVIVDPAKAPARLSIARMSGY